MHADKNSLPLVDTTNDLALLSASESNGITTITYKRKIATCDDEDNTITVGLNQ